MVDVSSSYWVNISVWRRLTVAAYLRCCVKATPRAQVGKIVFNSRNDQSHERQSCLTSRVTMRCSPCPIQAHIHEVEDKGLSP
jgi:hypothetical protein